MKKKSKRERFLEVALKLIHKKGFKATTMRDIAQELNCEVANVYNYIDSKQALLEEYLFDIQNEFHISIDQIIASTFTSDEKFKQVISSYIRITTRRPYEQALLVNDWRNLKEPKLQEFFERRKAYENKLQDIIAEACNKGEFRNLDIEMTTQTILATLRWLHNRCLNKNEALNPIEIEKQLLDFILNGIALKS